MATSKYKRFGIPAALVVGGVTAGSMLAPIGFASAQSDDDDAATTEESETTETPEESESESESNEGRRGRRGPGGFRSGGFKSEALTDALGLSQEEIRAGMSDGKTLAELAEEQGLSVDELKSALTTAITEAVDQAVEDGKIDADRAAERLAELDTKIDELVNKDPADFENRRAGHRGRMGSGGHGIAGKQGIAGKLGPAAEEIQELLGLSGEEIRDAVTSGSSLADLAEQQDVSVEELTAVLMSGIEERIDEAVESGKIDTDRAEEVKDGLDEMIDNLVNGEFDGSQRGFGGRGGHGRHGRHGHGGPMGGPGTDTGSSVEESSI